MSKFVPRLNAPSSTDKDWIHTSKGGYNSCIHIKNGSVLPNCVGYAWGRWRELLGKSPNLSRGNAENWWNYNDGYERGSEPKLGAVMVWRKGNTFSGSDGAGHVAIVEQVISSTEIVCSESGYNSYTFRTKNRKRGTDGRWGSGVGYTFLGFIYLPENLFEAEAPETTVSYKPTVKEWQKAAIADGFKFPKYGADGKWGNECIEVSKKAVLRYVKPYTNLNLTKIVQKVIGLTGSGVDGKYGANTKGLVIEFQREHGLVPDGEVGPATWKVILGV